MDYKWECLIRKLLSCTNAEHLLRLGAKKRPPSFDKVRYEESPLDDVPDEKHNLCIWHSNDDLHISAQNRHNMFLYINVRSYSDLNGAGRQPASEPSDALPIRLRAFDIKP